MPFLLLILLMFALPAQAAPTRSDARAMRFTIITAPQVDCGVRCPRWILADGLINADSLPRLRQVLNQAGREALPLVVNSGGGDVRAALAMGRLIRARGLPVLVGTGMLVPCTGSGCSRAPRGLALPGAVCASACVFLLAGGKDRIVSTRAKVGVHKIIALETLVRRERIYRVRRRMVQGRPVEISRTLVKERILDRTTRRAQASRTIYTLVARYIAEMGLDASFVDLMRLAEPEAIHWLSEGELSKTRLATSRDWPMMWLKDTPHKGRSPTPQ